MLKEFMRSYAVNMGFAPDDADYAADGNEDQGLYALSLNDAALCTVAPYEDDGKSFALAVIACGGFADESELELKAKALMQDFELYSKRKCSLIAALTEDKVLGFFAKLPLDNCTQSDFDDFMSSLIYFVTAREDHSFVPKYADFSDNEESIDDFLRRADLEPEVLRADLDCINLPEGPVMIIKKPAQQELIFKTLIKKHALPRVILNCMSSNMQLLGRHFFSFDSSGNLFFETPLSIKNEPEAFYEMLSVHAGLSADFAEALDEEAAYDEGSLESNFSQFLMV